MDLDGRVALVTGASHGIGAAIAGRLAEAGVDVAVGYANDRTAAEEQTARISGMGRRLPLDYIDVPLDDVLGSRAPGLQRRSQVPEHLLGLRGHVALTNYLLRR